MTPEQLQEQKRQHELLESIKKAAEKSRRQRYQELKYKWEHKL